MKLKIKKDTDKCLKLGIFLDNLVLGTTIIALFSYGFVLYKLFNIGGLFLLALFTIPTLYLESSFSNKFNKIMLEIRELKKQ